MMISNRIPVLAIPTIVARESNERIIYPGQVQRPQSRISLLEMASAEISREREQR
jgi:hypothetical protein